MDDFCNDGCIFWDRNLTWDTTDPFFSPCFEETILIWAPAGFLFFFSFLDLNFSFKSRKKNDPVPWDVFSILKSLLCVTLIAVSLAQVIKIQGYDDSKAIDTLASAIRLVAYVVAFGLLFLSKMKGVRSSGVQFLYWGFATVCEGIMFRTAVRKYDSAVDDRMNFIYLMRFIIFPLVVIQLILNCWADGSWFSKTGKGSLFGFPPPDKNSSYLSKLLYWWYDSMAWKGYKHPLTFDDLWDLNDADKAGMQLPVFEKHWKEAVRRAKEQSNKTGKKVEAGIMSVLSKCFLVPFIAGGFMKLIQDLLAFVAPEILKLLMKHVTPDPITGEMKEETWKGFLYAACLLAVGFIQTMFGVQHNKRMMMVGMKIRTTLSSAVYRKALVVSNVAKKDTTVGEIVNLMSVDTQRFMDLAPMVHMVWTAPIQVAVCTYFLYNTLGWAVFAGLAVMILLIPFNGIVSTKARALMVRQMKLKDHRVKLMSELLGGMKVLKLYGWEPSFQEQIMKIRTQEMKLLRKAAILNTSVMFMFTCAPFLVSLATFAAYVLSDETHNLNAERAFVSLTLFNIMRMPLTMFPMVVASLVQSSVSVSRLNKYMNSEEIDDNAVEHDDKEKDPIIIRNGTFSWTGEGKTLQDINFRVAKGSLTAVVGAVGSGKSSLLGSLLGDLKKHSGQVIVNGSVAYVSQGAWIQNATLKDNILFNDPDIPSKYTKVIQACALETDLSILDAGDQTEIGEKGINLSGGQKQRVSLARAAYKEAEIYLWDDPLSAVDSHVGKHIFDQLIGPGGILKGKTRVLVTHGVAFLPQVDNIVVMQDGKISEVGTFKELLAKKGNFAEFLTQHLTNSQNGEELDVALVQEMEDVVGAEVLKRNSSLISRRRSTQESLRKGKPAPEKAKPKLMQEETAETGSVKAAVYLDYFRTAGLFLSVTSLVLNIVSAGSSTYSSIWLSDWSTEATIDEIRNNGTQNKDTTNLYLGVYGGLGGVQAVAILFASLTLAFATLNSAASLHFRMLSRVMKAPMSYFDTTPLGRLVNRFAKDVDTVDILVPLNIRASLSIVLNVLSAVVNISYSTPIFLAFIVPVFIFYFFMQRFYVATSRQLKRIESVTRSPIYSKFGETISGATTIRAFNLQDEFIAESERKIDINQQAYFPYIASSLWIAVRLEGLGSLIIFAAGVFAVTSRETIEPSVVGLSISSALTFTGLLNFLVRTTSDLETNIIAVERMKELTVAPQEAAWITDKRPKKEWPEHGQVIFNAYQTRYREGLDLVLRGITCSFKPGEKIGIVGRTGAGKSSLTLALFRLVEPSGGTIHIDGYDITEIGLHDLRSRITIIPQDPVLFSGNLRINLDPFDAYTDDQVWTCLESAHLKQYVSSLPAKLDHEVAEEGQNFSVGQRQLVCLARALLRKTKILVLDEATAAVDLETDDLIQTTIRREFEHCTVITIAHRLNTIMDSTRVVVLDKGQIIEFDTPANLLSNTDSVFYGMAKDAGLT